MIGFPRRHRLDPDLTPEEREERIAELRRKRRARMRVLAIRSALLTGGLVLLLVAVVYWLVSTIGGRDVLLAQIVQRLPANATLSWQKAEGPVSGPLTMHDVRFTYDAIVFTAQRVTLEPALLPLLGKHLRLDALQVENATLDLPASDEPFELPRWPDSLPQINPPLALTANDIQIDGFQVSSEGEPTINIRRLRGGLQAQPGSLHVQELVVDSDRGRFTAHGDYAPADNYRTDLLVTAVLPAAAGRTPARFGLLARGDLDEMDLGLGGRAPGEVRATVILRGKDRLVSPPVARSGPVMASVNRPQWQLRARAGAIDIGLLTDPQAAPAETPLALQLQVDGVGGDARLRGEVRQGEFSAKVLNSRLRVEDQVLDLDPLRLELLDGTVVARGTADFNDPANASFRFATNARGLQWGSPTALAADADFGLAGTLQGWALIGNATLTRDGEHATLTLDGRGNSERMDLKALDVAMPTGTLAATGRIAWAPALAWDIDSRLAGFDPGYFAAGWNGSVNGHITSTGGARDDGRLEATLDLADLGGRLHGKPLAGKGHFTMSGASPAGDVARYQGELALGIGGSRIDAKGSYGDRVDVDARFAPLNLQDLLPDASGTLRGTARVQGPAAGPDIRADLVGSNLKFADYAANALTIKGELPWSRGDGQLAIRGDGLALGAPIDRLVVDARGAVEQLRVSATAGREGLASLALDASLNHRGNRWQGTLSRLGVDMERGADWNLRAPAGFAWAPAPNGSSVTLEPACLASTAGGSLCVNADWPRRGLSVVGEGLPVALIEPYLPEREHRQPWLLRGEIAIDAHIRPVGNGWDGQARITSPGGGIRNSERSRTELLSYENLALTATFRPQGIEAEFGTGFNGDGRIDASLRTGWDTWSPLSGQLSLNTRELTWMELFSPDIVEPTGRLNAQITVAGTRDTPQLGGQARLADFSTELPALAITLREGNLQLDAMADGTARIHGSVRSASSAGNDGNGVLSVNGTLGWKGDDTPLVLRLSGSDVLVSDTPDLRAVASPDLQLNYQIGQPMRLSGTINVPEAMVNLEGLDHAVSPSADVVVLDPVNPDEGPGTPLAMDLRITVGDNVRMKGFGLTGKVDGNMHLLARPGRELAATGAINVAGEYKAYGQDLTITRGLLSWSNDPVSNPVVNLRAERVIGEVTAGVDVSGRATAPQASVWSNPASSQPEALAYLTLGRPLSTLSGDQRGDLNAANAALTAGGGMLASQLATKIGLEDAGVVQSRALGGSVFGFGKQLSPRMYVGYGVSLLGTGQVLTLKYLLDHGFDIEIESSTLEDRGSINWRKEK